MRRQVGILVLALLVAGCGTAKIDLKTDVLSPNEVNQEITITADGAVGEALRESFNPDNLRSEGWATELKSEGNAYVMRASKKMKASDAWLPPASSGAAASTASDSKFDFRVTEGVLDREYAVLIVMPPSKANASSTPAKTEADRQMQQLGEQIAKSMFKMSWTINLPGEITDTNADHRTKNGGTWELGLDQMQKGVEMRISSKERKDLTLFAVGGAILLGLAVLGVYRLRAKGSGETATP